MTDSKKPISRISAGDADAIATRLVEQLIGPSEDAEIIGNQLAEQYTVAARRQIIVRIGKLLQDGERLPGEETMLAFLRTQLTGVTVLTIDSMIRTLLTTAIASAGSRPGHEMRVAAAFWLDLLSDESGSGDHKVVLGQESLRELATADDRMGGVLARVPKEANRQGRAGKGTMRRWLTCIVPFLGLRNDSTTSLLSSDDAACILDALIEMDAEGLPDEMILAMPSLLALDKKADLVSFFKSPIGELTARLMSQAKGTESQFGDFGNSFDHAFVAVDVQRPLQGEEAQFLQTVTEFLTRLQEARLSTEEALSQKEAQLDAALQRQEQLEAELNTLRRKYHDELRMHTDRIAEMEADASRLTRVRDDLIKRLVDANEEIDKWKQETRLTQRQSELIVQRQQSEQQEKLYKNLLQPTHNLRSHIIRLLKNDRDNKQLRVMAAAFDTLDARILRLVNEPAKLRIPPELFADHFGGEQDNE